jgi:hypothetical protein
MVWQGFTGSLVGRRWDRQACSSQSPVAAQSQRRSILLIYRSAMALS